MIYRLTFGFAGGNQGWSETHAMQQPSADPTTLLPLIANLAQARANFLGAPFAVNAVRIAKFFDETIGQRVKGSFLLKQNFTTVNPNLVGGAEPGEVALIGNWAPNTTDPALAPFAGHQSETHFGAPPDLAVNNGGIVDQGQAGLGLFVGSFRAAMIAANTGWLALARAADTQILKIAQNLDGTITITLVAPPVPAPAIGVMQTVRTRGINKGNTPIPGQLRGTFATNTTFVSAVPIGIPTPQIGGFVRTYTPNPTFLPYLGMVLEGVAGNHKRGRPFGSSRGRRRVRVLG